MHIYIFGSVCRGDVSLGSDIDLLAVVEGYDPRFDTGLFSIYSYERLKQLWQEGNPFAWHLLLESKLVHSSDESDYIKSLGRPELYTNCIQDCEKFFTLFREARSSIMAGIRSRIFDLSTIFLSIRNIATCYSLGATQYPDFSRSSALRIGSNSIPLPKEPYKILERARILSIRGYGKNIKPKEVNTVIEQLGEVAKWMSGLVEKAKAHE